MTDGKKEGVKNIIHPSFSSNIHSTNWKVNIFVDVLGIRFLRRSMVKNALNHLRHKSIVKIRGEKMRAIRKQQIFVLLMLYIIMNGYFFPRFSKNHNHNSTHNTSRTPSAASESESPTYAFFQSYLGGSGNDEGNDICVDSSGYCYITGESESDDFPVQNAIQIVRGAGYLDEGYDRFDGIVVKLNPDQSINYSTYLGGNKREGGKGIASDGDGACYITGFTQSSDFPILNAINSTRLGGYDVFITKLNADGSLNFSTFFGGSGDDFGEVIARDQQTGAFFIAGRTDSYDFPIQNAINSTYAQNEDVFLSKFNSDGSLNFSTYIGGSDSEECKDIAIDKFGVCYLVGNTDSTDFPVINTTFTTPNTSFDGFLTKINPDGSLNYSSRIGGSWNDYCYGLSVNTKGEYVVTGNTHSVDFPLLNAFDEDNEDIWTAYVMKFNSNGSLNFSTYLGGEEDDFGLDLHINEDGSCCIIGTTYSEDFPVQNEYHSSFYSSEFQPGDGFLTKFNPDGSLNFSTILGESGYEYLSGIDVYNDKIFFLTGTTESRHLKLIDPIDNELSEREF